MRKLVKIVATLGPSTSSKDVLRKMVQAGMDVARLNIKHGSIEEHVQRGKMIRSISNRVPLLVDVMGPSIRTSRTLKPIKVERDQVVRITEEFFNRPEVFKSLEEGTRILIADGRIVLEVESLKPKYAVARSLSTGVIEANKNVALPGVDVAFAPLTEHDKRALRTMKVVGIDMVGASFISTATDVLEVREFLESIGSEDTWVVSKIESERGVRNVKEIVEESDAVMVARGDLGIEMPLEKVPLIQKRIIREANKKGKPVIVATQMLESMISNPTPTRAEATDVANAVLDGADAVMLSGETSVGQFPVEAVATMKRIILETQEALEERVNESVELGVYDFLALSSVILAQKSNAKAILTVTTHGTTVLRIARYRPTRFILAFTEDEKLARNLNLVYGVKSFRMDFEESLTSTLRKAVKIAKNHGLLHDRDPLVAVLGAWSGVPGATEMIMFGHVGDVF